ncbi:MAG: TraB/GumN family protein [Flavobacteriales bacterium]|nr:TraB/GumN family protein [Flavobacteriales bacterium]
MRIALAFLLFAPLYGAAQDLEPTLLWRITTPGIPASSYLYGTVHSKDDRAYQFGDSVLPALDRCAVAAGELDLSTANAEMGMALLTTMRMSGDRKLEDLYKKKDWKRVDAAIQEGMGFMAPMTMRMKPFFVMALLTENAMDGDQDQVLDEFLQQRAKANGQRVMGIETVKEQMAAVDAIPIEEQAAMLLDHVDHKGYQDQMDAMLDVYARQDIEQLIDVAEKTGTMPDSFERSLLTERNARMVQRMDKLLRDGGSIFFLIGAAHLPRPDGLIAGLRAQGHTVEAVISDSHQYMLETEPVEEER